jgi:hypothetical protein
MNKVKRYIWLLCLLFLINQFYLPVFAAEISSSSLSIYVDNVKIDARLVNKNGVIYAPVYTLATALKANIEWNARLNIIKINGNLVSSQPYLSSGEVLLSVDAITQAIGGAFSVDGQSNTVRISTKPSANTAESSSSGTAGNYNPALTFPGSASSTVAPVYTESPTSTYDNSAGATSRKTFPTDLMNSTSSSTGSSTSQYPSQNPSFAITPPYAEQPSGAPLTPVNAPPQMPQNFQVPPVMPDNSYSINQGPFIPKTSRNSVFSVTVTNMEEMDVIKGYYKPKPNNKFVIVYLSQSNTSDEVQIYTGKFALLDGANSAYDYIEGLSNFWLVILKPGGTNFGYLVFEMPKNARPMNLMLHALNQKPLSISLY